MKFANALRISIMYAIYQWYFSIWVYLIPMSKYISWHFEWRTASTPLGCVKDSASAPSFLGLVGGCPGVSSFRSMVHRTRYSLSTGLLTPWSAWWWCGWPSSYCFLSLVWTGHLENIRICRNEYAETSVTVAHGKVEVDSVVARHKWMEWKYKMRGWHEMYAACNRSCIRMRFSRGVRRQELPDHGCCLWASFADLRHEPLWPKMIQRCLR